MRALKAPLKLEEKPAASRVRGAGKPATAAREAVTADDAPPPAKTRATRTRKPKAEPASAAGISSAKVPPAKKKAPTRAQKGKAKAAAPPKAKAPAKKRETKSKATAQAKPKPKKEKKESTKLPPPLGTVKKVKKTKAEATIPGWNSEGLLLWKCGFFRCSFFSFFRFFFSPIFESLGISDAHQFLIDLFSFQKKKHRAYGDLSRMPKTDSIVAVSLNNGPVQVGDSWRREQGYFSKDEGDW